MNLFTLMFLLYSSLHLYMFFCLYRSFGKRLLLVPAALWLLLAAGAWYMRRISPALWGLSEGAVYVWMGFAICLFPCLFAADLFLLSGRVAARIRGVAFSFPVRRAMGLALLASLGLYAYGIHEAYSLNVIRVTVPTSKLLPGGGPLRIAAFSDLHVGPLIGPRRVRRVAEAVAAEKPDIIVVAGDLVDGNMENRNEDAAILRSMPAPLGKFGVLGNHEYYQGRRNSLTFFEKSGIRVLRGENTEVGGIVLAGVDDPTFARLLPSPEGAHTEYRNALPESSDKFVLFLAHNPAQWPVARCDLQFSGHTHGGQIWPGILLTRAMFGREQGLTEYVSPEGKISRLFLSNGIGFWGPMLRLGAPPDIVVFDIIPQ